MAKAIDEYHIEGQKSIWKGQLTITNPKLPSMPIITMPVKIFSAISELESAHLSRLCQ
jgi:hypothetical protein